MYWRMFDAAWFARHQRTLLALVNAPVLGRWLRWVLCITRHDIGYRRRITRLLPHAYEVRNPDGTRTLDVRTHPKYAKRVYYAFRPIWWALHAWDAVIANPLCPALNAGFDTLTAYPDPGDPGTTTIDGSPERNVAGESWATLISSAGTGSFGNNTGVNYATFIDVTAPDLFKRLMRPMFLFDTSPLSGGSVSDATLSLYGWGKSDTPGNAPSVAIYGATPASNTTLTGSDYASVGTTVFSGTVTYAAWDTAGYNAFTFNTSGLAAIATTGVSKFVTRMPTYDVGGTTPLWGDGSLGCYHADQTGTTNDPKLEVTFSPQGRNRVTLGQNVLSAVANFTNSASTSLAFGSAVSAGQLLTLCFTSGSSNGSSGVQLSTVNDSVNSTGRWQRAVRQRSTAAASSLGAEIWYLVDSSAGTPTVTVTLASTAAGRFLYGLQSWSNASTVASDVLGTVVSTAANSSLCALPSMSSLSSGSVLVTVYKTLAGVTNRTNPSGWSTLAPQNSTRENSFYLLKTDTAASSATWQISAAAQYVVVGAEFRGSTFTPSTVASKASGALPLIGVQ